MKLPTRILCAFALCCLSIAGARAEIIERIVAVINNDVITLSELDEVIEVVHGPALAQISDARARDEKRRELRAALLDQMVDQRLLTQQYDKLQITASEQDVDLMIDAICKQNNISRDVLKSELERQGMSYSEYRDQMRQHVLQGKFIEQHIRPKINITEEDLKGLYTRKLGELQEGEVVELTGVLVAVARGGGPGAVEAAKKQADSAREQLIKGGSPDDIARKSSGGTIESLGEMGSFKRGELMETLDAAVFALKPGEVTAPIETSQGIYILKAKSFGKQSDAKSFEQVRDQLYRRLYDQQVEQQLQLFVKNARKEAHVEVLL